MDAILGTTDVQNSSEVLVEREKFEPTSSYDPYDFSIGQQEHTMCLKRLIDAC